MKLKGRKRNKVKDWETKTFVKKLKVLIRKCESRLL